MERNEASRPEYEEDQSQMSKSEIHKTRIKGEALYSNMPSEEAIKERDEIVELLERYDRAVPGVNTKDFRKELKQTGNKPAALNKLKKKLDRVANNEWRRRAENHEAYNAPGKLGRKLKSEMMNLWKSFKGQDLLKGDYNKFELLTTMDETLKAKAEFVKRYKKQSPLVRKLYEQSMGELDFTGSKEKLLDKVLKIVGDLEHSPQAIQKEFKERAKKIHDSDKLKVMKGQLIKEYGEMDTNYEAKIRKNEEYFGGETADEFIQWFGEQKTFAQMKSALKLLPKYISERKEEHIKIEGLLKDLPEKKVKQFREIVNKLGLSERKRFRKETLEPAFRSGNVSVAEYEGELLAAHQDRVPLYTVVEKMRLAARFKTLKPAQQKQVLLAERLNIARRSQVIRQYKRLPLTLRDDLAFYKGNAIDRDELLFNAQEKLAEGNTINPFAQLENDEHLDNKQIRDISQAIDSNAGQEALDDAFHEEVGERDRKNISNVINLAKWKMEHALEANQKNETQKETFVRDYESWKVGLSEGDHHKDAKLEEDWLKGNKIRESQMAENIYEKGFTTHANSSVHERQDLKRSDLVDLKGQKITEAMSMADYDTDIHLAENDEKEPVDVAAMLGEVVEEIAEKMAKEMIEGLANRINATGGNRSVLINSLSSARNMENIKDQFWDNEMGERGKVLRNKKAA